MLGILSARLDWFTITVACHELPHSKGEAAAKMSHKATATPAGCYFNPGTPTLLSSAQLTPLKPSSSFSRPFNVHKEGGVPGTSPPPSVKASVPERESPRQLGDEPKGFVSMPSTMNPTSADIQFQDIPATVQRKVRAIFVTFQFASRGAAKTPVPANLHSPF